MASPCDDKRILRERRTHEIAACCKVHETGEANPPNYVRHNAGAEGRTD